MAGRVDTSGYCACLSRFPAFLRSVDVDLKLHVPGWGVGHPPAELRVVAKGGEVISIDLEPASRRADVVVLALQD